MQLTRPSWTTVITLLISLAAAIFSGTNLWRTEFAPADIHFQPSEIVGFGYDPQNQDLLIVMPTVVSNYGARTGAVQSMGIAVLDPHKQNAEAPFLKWSLFAAFDANFVLTKQDRAVPICLPGRTSAFRYIYFSGAGDFRGWMPEPRSYTLRIAGWTQEVSGPDKSLDLRVTFTPDDCTTLKQFLDNERGWIQWVFRDEWGKWKAKMLSPVELQQIPTPKR